MRVIQAPARVDAIRRCARVTPPIRGVAIVAAVTRRRVVIATRARADYFLPRHADYV